MRSWGPAALLPEGNRAPGGQIRAVHRDVKHLPSSLGTAASPGSACSSCHLRQPLMRGVKRDTRQRTGTTEITPIALLAKLWLPWPCPPAGIPGSEPAALPGRPPRWPGSEWQAWCQHGRLRGSRDFTCRGVDTGGPGAGGCDRGAKGCRRVRTPHAPWDAGSRLSALGTLRRPPGWRWPTKASRRVPTGGLRLSPVSLLGTVPTRARPPGVPSGPSGNLGTVCFPRAPGSPGYPRPPPGCVYRCRPSGSPARPGGRALARPGPPRPASPPPARPRSAPFRHGTARHGSAQVRPPPPGTARHRTGRDAAVPDSRTPRGSRLGTAPGPGELERGRGGDGTGRMTRPRGLRRGPCPWGLAGDLSQSRGDPPSPRCCPGGWQGSPSPAPGSPRGPCSRGRGGGWQGPHSSPQEGGPAGQGCLRGTGKGLGGGSGQDLSLPAAGSLASSPACGIWEEVWWGRILPR